MPTPPPPLTRADHHRIEANRLIDEALKGGISFMFDDAGQLLRWQALPDIDPGPSETYGRLCDEIDHLRREIRAELRKRLPSNGEILLGSPLLGEAGSPMVTKAALERAWAARRREGGAS
jgi:hypothetical protein